MLNYFYSLKRYFIDTNIFFPVQLLFTWFFFNLLGFLKVSFYIKFIASFFCFVLLFYTWEFIVGFILNNIIFQYYYFIFLHLVDLLLVFENLPFWLATLFSFVFCIIFEDPRFVELNFTSFYVPNFECVLFILFFFRFGNKLSNVILYESMKSGRILPFKNNIYCWGDIISILYLAFAPKITVVNKIKFLLLSNFLFVNYPFQKDFLIEVAKPENDVPKTNLKLLDKYENYPEKFILYYNDFLSKRLQRFRPYLTQHVLMNNIFFFKIFYGLLFGLLLSMLYFNLYFLLLLQKGISVPQQGWFYM